MADFDRISDFVKSSARRLGDAEELFQPPTYRANENGATERHLRGAMYLAGYSIECLLKAYLISQEGCRSLTEAQDRINQRRARRGKEPIRDIANTAAGHSIGYLLQQTDLPERPGYEPKLWGRLGRWKASWRYDPTIPPRDEAEAFLEDIRAAVNWLKPRVGF